jgi:DNA-binding NarL/FixJ family response regulator
MNARSVVWIAPAFQSGGVELEALRNAGFFPVPVESVEGALNLLRQFHAGAVILPISDERGWHECARLLATGSPIVVLGDLIRPEVTQRYLSAGCAAVIDVHCPPDQLTAALMRVSAGDVRVVELPESTTLSPPTWFHAERGLPTEVTSRDRNNV